MGIWEQILAMEREGIGSTHYSSTCLIHQARLAAKEGQQEQFVVPQTAWSGKKNGKQQRKKWSMAQGFIPSLCQSQG